VPDHVVRRTDGSVPVIAESQVGRSFLKGKKRASAKETYESAPWWMKAVTYQILVRSFADSNGDGVGDLDGVRKKLDYLQWLGVDCIWLNPFLDSPLKDDGYDVSDYFSVLPQYGNIKSLEKLIEEAHARGMKVLMDVAVNHTSDQHPWFQRAVAAPPGSPERNFYVWNDDDSKYPDARIIFVDTEKSNWTYHPEAKQYYWHRFFSHQPDLNFDSEEVQKALCDVFGFWVDKGVDGFRLDAIPYLFERDGTNCENLDETHGFVKRMRRFLEEKSPDRPIALLAEANQPRTDVVKYFGDGDECHLAYDFNLMPEIYQAFAAGTARGFEGKSTGLAKVLGERPALPPNCIMPGFLRNHDELTLEMVTDDVRKEMYAAFAQDPRARRNVGIGRRLAPLLDNDPEKLRLAHALLLSLDSPVMYYGDEIGMGDDLDLPDRHPVRTPMQWDSASPNAGFSTAPSEKLAAPLVRTRGFTAKEINVADQMRDRDSLLNHVQHLLDVRRARPELSMGRLDVIGVGNPDVLGFTRTLGKRKALCLYNFGDEPRKVRLDTRVIGGNHLRSLIKTERHGFERPDDLGVIEMTLAPKEALWLGVSKRAKAA
jgi:maltose alpha-D-glucosyltransferase/alpha-amylase